MRRLSILFILSVCLAGFLGSCGGGGEPSPAQLGLTLDQTLLPQGTVGAFYNQTVSMTASGGTAPYVYSCSVPDEATGLSASVSSAAPATGGVSCVISGTPLTAGEITVNFSATDARGLAYTSALSIGISPVPDPLDIWHVRSSLPQGDVLYDVNYGNGMFVAVGSDDTANSGLIVTSYDGIKLDFEKFRH